MSDQRRDGHRRGGAEDDRDATPTARPAGAAAAARTAAPGSGAAACIETDAGISSSVLGRDPAPLPRCRPRRARRPRCRLCRQSSGARPGVVDGEDLGVRRQLHQLGVRADRRERAVEQQRDAVGQGDGRRVGARRPARWSRRAPPRAPARPRPRCGRRGPTAGRRARGRWAARRRPGPARCRCRCPPDSESPCSPIRVSRPHGRSLTNVAWARSSAASISASDASGRPSDEVLPHAHREQHRVLERGRDLAAQRRQREVADVDAVERDPAARHVVQPRRQRGQDALAGAGRADDRDRLPRLDVEGDVAQRRLVGVVELERHRLEAEPAARA